MDQKSELVYCSILNTNINVTTMDKTISYLERNLEELRGKYICISNVHTTIMAYQDEEYRRIQNSSVMALPDGKPLSIVSRKRGFRQAERVAGPDLMLRVIKESREKGYRHFFYGSSEKTLDALRKRLTEQYPWITIAGMYAPPFREMTQEEDEEAIRRINETEPDFIWVALGAPKQEIWMYQHQGKLNGIMLGVGAAFDFNAGTVKRAPKWMQECCLEWLYRIFQDPLRLTPRYLKTNLAYILLTCREGLQLRKKQKLKKIAMIGHKRIPSREGGIEIVVDELSTRLVSKGFQVDAYNRSGYHISGKQFDEERGKIYNGIRLITIPTFKSSSLNAIVYSFLATIRSLFEKYSICHYHAEGPCAMLWMQKLFGRRVVVTIHGLDWQRAKWGNLATRVLKFGEKQAVRHADEIIVLSENLQNYFKKQYGRDTVFIPNGISRPMKKEAGEIIKRWGLEKEEYILFLARLVPEKGAHYLIEAYEDMKTEKKLVIAGGNSHSAEYVSQIYKKAEKDNRIILTNFVQGQELEELYSNAYLFVLPSDVEGMALGLLEAMSYGNCCLVSDIRENMEVAGENAVSFEKGNVADLRAKLAWLLEDQEVVARYRAKSADYICGKYNWDEVVEQTIAVYKRAMREKNEDFNRK